MKRPFSGTSDLMGTVSVLVLDVKLSYHFHKLPLFTGLYPVPVPVPVPGKRIGNKVIIPLHKIRDYIV